MTGLNVAFLALLVSVALPVAAASTEMSREEDAQVDSLSLEIGLTAGAETEQVDMQQELAWADTSFMATYVPSESKLVNFFDFCFLALAAQMEGAQAPAAETPSVDAPAVEVPVADAEAEADALMTQGIRTESQTHSSNQYVSIDAQAQAGSIAQTASAEARPSDELPLTEVEKASSVASLGTGAGNTWGPESTETDQEPQGSAGGEIAPQEIGMTPVLATEQEVVVQPISLPAALATTAAVLGASTTTAVLAVPGWRTTAMRLLRRFGWMVLFSRIAQEDILNHERRSELLEYVRNNPGERVEVARKTLGFSNGSMHYHLRVLQDRGLVKILKEGSLARLYPRGPKINPAPYVPAQRKRFLDALSIAPGQTQRQLSQSLGLSERMVSYHVQALAGQGLLEVRAEGARKRLFPAQTCTSTQILAPAS